MWEGGGFFCKYFQGWWGPIPPTSPPIFSPLAQSRLGLDFDHAHQVNKAPCVVALASILIMSTKSTSTSGWHLSFPPVSSLLRRKHNKLVLHAYNHHIKIQNLVTYLSSIPSTLWEKSYLPFFASRIPRGFVTKLSGSIYIPSSGSSLTSWFMGLLHL